MMQYPHKVVTRPSKWDAAACSRKLKPTTAKCPMWYGQNANTKINSVFNETTQNTCSKNTSEPSNPRSLSHVSSSAARSHSIGFQFPSSAAAPLSPTPLPFSSAPATAAFSRGSAPSRSAPTTGGGKTPPAKAAATGCCLCNVQMCNEYRSWSLTRNSVTCALPKLWSIQTWLRFSLAAGLVLCAAQTSASTLPFLTIYMLPTPGKTVSCETLPTVHSWYIRVPAFNSIQ